MLTVFCISKHNSFCNSCIILLHRSSFLTTDCNKDHQATLLEKDIYSLALFTKTKIVTLNVNGICKNSWDIVLFAH